MAGRAFRFRAHHSVLCPEGGENISFPSVPGLHAGEFAEHGAGTHHFLLHPPAKPLPQPHGKKNFRSFLRLLFFDKNETILTKSLSVGLGIFIGIAPIWGFQILAGLFLAFLFRLNRAIVLIACNISLPPFIPVIIYLSYQLGAVLMGENAVPLTFSTDINLNVIKESLGQYIIGALLLATTGGILSFIITMLTRGS